MYGIYIALNLVKQQIKALRFYFKSRQISLREIRAALPGDMCCVCCLYVVCVDVCMRVRVCECVCGQGGVHAYPSMHV